MKKWISILMVLALLLTTLTGCISSPAPAPEEEAPAPAERTAFRVASLKGPTTMGMVKLMSDSEAGSTLHDYTFNMYGTADEIVPLLVNGDVDVALVPCNLASVLYNKTQGAVQVAAINTLGVIYVVESGDTVQSVEDLRGKTIYSTGKGTTPEFALNYILTQNGIVPGTDVTIEFKSEATELAVLLSGGENAIAVLPQPYVTTVQMQNDKVRTALSLSEEWDKVSTDSGMVTGVLLVRKEFAEANKAAFDEFLGEYQASTAFTNDNIAEAAALIEGYGIVPKAAIAEAAIPACNIVYIDGDEMQTKVGGYLEVLFAANAQSVGGAIPNEDFYYKK